MNFNNVVSLPASQSFSGLEGVAVTIDATTGLVRIAASTDPVIGTVVRGQATRIPDSNYVVDVFLRDANGLRYVRISDASGQTPAGNNNAATAGARLALHATNGGYYPSATGTAAIALEPIPANSHTAPVGLIRAILL